MPSTAAATARRRPMRGSVLRTLAVVVALGAGAYIYGKPYFTPQAELLVRNRSGKTFENVVVTVTVADDFGQLERVVGAPHKLGRLPTGEDLEVPLGATGKARISVKYMTDFQEHQGAYVGHFSDDLDVLLDVRHAGVFRFSEGNGVW